MGPCSTLQKKMTCIDWYGGCNQVKREDETQQTDSHYKICVLLKFLLFFLFVFLFFLLCFVAFYCMVTAFRTVYVSFISITFEAHLQQEGAITMS